MGSTPTCQFNGELFETSLVRCFLTPQASTRNLYAISKFKMMTKSCYHEAKENVPPPIKQYKNRGNASNLVQSHFGSPRLKNLESGIAPLFYHGSSTLRAGAWTSFPPVHKIPTALTCKETIFPDEMSHDLHSLSKENDRLRLIHKQQVRGGGGGARARACARARKQERERGEQSSCLSDLQIAG